MYPNREIPSPDTCTLVQKNSFLSDWKARTGLGLKISVRENVQLDVTNFIGYGLETILERPRIVIDCDFEKTIDAPLGFLVVPKELETADIDMLSELHYGRNFDDYDLFPFVQVHILHLVFTYPNTQDFINYDPWDRNRDHDKYILQFSEAKRELYEYLCKEYKTDTDICKIRNPIDHPYYVIDKTVGSIDCIEGNDRNGIVDPNKIVVSSFCTCPSFIDIYVTMRGSRVEREMQE